MFIVCSPAADNFQLEYKVSKNRQVKVRSIENSILLCSKINAISVSVRIYKKEKIILLKKNVNVK